MAEELRQAINKIDLVGIVKEQKLKEGKSENGKYINGSLVVKTGEFSEVELKVMVSEKNKKGDVKKAYETLKKFVDGDLMTLADCKTEEDREAVTRIRAYGNKEFTPHFREDIFKAKDSDEVKTKVGIDLGFGNIFVDNSIKEEDFKAEFDVEMFVNTVKEEMKGEEATGRVIVSGYVPVYGGKVIPMEVVAGKIIDDDGEEYDFADDVLSQIEEGMTIDVWGEIDYKAIITTTKKGGGLGKAKVETSKTYINDLIMTGADIIEDEEKAFEMELVKKAKTERDIEIEGKKEEKSEGESKKGKGLNSGSSGKARRDRPSF